MAVASWLRVAYAMFAVGWGANQFSPMLIVYRHEQGLSAAAVAGLFAVYAATLIPGLLAGGPASDRLGRRAVVLPFVILSPAATVMLVAGAHDLPLIIAGRALAGICSGVVIGPASAWVRDLSLGSTTSARRAAFALTAGFGLGPVAAALLAQWAPDPLVVPYLPHIVLGVAAIAALWPARGTAVTGTDVTGTAATGTDATGADAGAGTDAAIARTAGRERRVPAALRTWPFWMSVAPAAPLVFGPISLAIVVLPEEVTSARTLSAGYAGLMTALAFAAGVAVQPLARGLDRRVAGAGSVAGLCCSAAGAAAAIPALLTAGTTTGNAGTVAAGIAAMLLGAGYGLNLVSGLHQAETLARPAERGTVLAVYYVLAYLGFGAPYLTAVLTALTSKTAAFAILAAVAAALAAWTAGWSAVLRRSSARHADSRRTASASSIR